MTSEKPQTIVEATVAAHEIWKGKPLTKLDIPAWSSQYPIPLYGIKPEQQAQLPIGQTLKVVLNQDNQKDNTDGGQPWHFFWSFNRLADAAAVPTAAAQPATTSGAAPAQAAPAASYEASNELKGEEIRRAVALKAAVEYTVLTLSGSNGPETKAFVNESRVLEIADSFVEWLKAPAATSKESVEAQPEPAAPAPVAEAPPVAEEEEVPADPDFDDLTSAVDAQVAAARAILTRILARPANYVVKEDLFDAMMKDMEMGPISVKKILGDLTPKAWLKKDDTRTFRDAARKICETVIADA